MPIVKRDSTSAITSASDFLLEYGSPRPRSNQHGKKGDLCFNEGKTIVNVICDKCGKLYTVNSAYTLFKSRSALHDPATEIPNVHCAVCTVRISKKLRHGDENFNNKSRIRQTCMLRYGKPSPPHATGYKLKPFSMEHRGKLSEIRKALKGKLTHKPMSLEAKRRMIESNSKTWALKIVNGEINWKVGYKSGKFFSKKNNKSIHFRSSYEKTFLVLLENADEIKEYIVEPFSISYFLQGLEKRYTPDVLITYHSGVKHLVEIKPAALSRTHINLLKFKAAKQCVEKLGVDEFFVITEGEFWRYAIYYCSSFFLNLSSTFLDNLQENLRKVVTRNQLCSS